MTSADNRFNENRNLVAGHQWGLQIQREVDTLVAATNGVGLSQLMLALATEAVIADNGSLKDSSGEAGYAWSPTAQKTRTDPVTARIRAAGASLGRVLAGGHPTHRTYLAILEAVYVVTTQQTYDVAERIEKLWDESDRMVEVQILEREEREKPGLLRRFWSWFKHDFLLIEGKGEEQA